MQAQFTHTTPTGTITISGTDYLFFSGFSYLGLHSHPAFKELLKEGIDRYGTVFISSRIANTRLQLYEELEQRLAALLRQQTAASFPSGYLASQAAVQYAATQGILLYAPNTHPALWTGNPAIPSETWADWAVKTTDKVNAHPDNTFVIVADGVNALTSTINDFSWLTAIRRQVIVVIDDAHGIGIVSDDGSGIISRLPQHPAVRYLLAASMAKAYSIQGGIVAGHTADITAVKKTALFTGATPMMPANAWAFLQSFSLHAAQRNILRQRIAYFEQLTAGRDELHNPFHLPIFVLKGGNGVEQYLLKHGIMISSFGYPDPDSPPVNRIIISAQHTVKDLEELSASLINT
ncbi:hypothetical protein [Chitinophaga rhizophila]|uniref:7-keto-8-aminopelargonate synthetase-like enzyme n=1 Tax=Chitinophaga rhizophila TaxID=2866212 RepID=A0ABS7G713_9BACT|nr:hypothetical protein [Chitinophaga rhizophila]MBW8683241.1 hypothetical protein [Chitinophaga rhizophila]